MDALPRSLVSPAPKESRIRSQSAIVDSESAVSESQPARDGRFTGDPVRRTHQPSHKNSLTSHLEPPHLDRLVPSAQAGAPYKAPDARILHRAVDRTPSPFLPTRRRQ